MKFTIRLQLSLLTAMLVIIASASFAIIFYYDVKEVIIDNTMQQLGIEISRESKRLSSKTEKLKKDVLYQASMPSVHAFARQRSKLAKQNIITSFENLLKIEADYHHIRYIDIHGNELIRVEQHDGKITVEDDKNLQNKKNRPYIKYAYTLKKDQVYFSAINLNREYGQISIPYQPVLRSVAPVFIDSKLLGFVVINMDFGKELQRIESIYSIPGESVYITDQHGSYLVNPDNRKEFGLDLGHRYRAQEDFPHAATLYLPGNTLQQKTLLPHEHFPKAIVFAKVPIDVNSEERYLVVAIARDEQMLDRQLGILANKTLPVVLLLLVSTVLAFWFSGHLTQPLKIIGLAAEKLSRGEPADNLPVKRHDEIGKLAHNFLSMATNIRESREKLQDLNINLEQQVANRTRELTRFKTTLDKTLDCVFMFSAKQLKFFYVNEGATQQVGYSKDELLSMHPYDIKPDMDPQSFKEMIAPMLNGECEVINFETHHQHKDGHTIPVEIFLQYIKPENEEARFVAFVRDISERKKVDRMKNEFISTVSHELRTPLTSIRGSLGLLTGGTISDIPEQARQLLNIAQKNTERLLLLINDILDISKIESGKMDFDFRHVQVQQLLSQAIETNQDYAKQFSVNFELLDQDDTLYVHADEDRLQQVLSNLLSNAAKFSPPGSTVKVRYQPVDNRVRISVTDSGPGIPEEFRNSIFDRFVQADSSDTRNVGGTGLGLNIARAIVNKHNGVIDFESQPGVGTTFFFELPLNNSHTGQAIPSPLQPKAHRHVLICEDDDDIASLLKILIEQQGYTADIAGSAQQCRELLATNHYQAMTLDIMLPGESGVDLLHHIRNNPDTSKLPVIVISAIADETRKQLNGGAVEVVDWFSKPIDQQRLVKDLHNIFEVSRADEPRVLHVEDEQDVHSYVKALFKDKVVIESAANLEEARHLLAVHNYELVILDINLPDGSGFDLLPTINSLKPTPSIVVFSAQEVSKQDARLFNEVLVKTRASNEQIFDTIFAYLDTHNNRTGKELS